MSNDQDARHNNYCKTCRRAVTRLTSALTGEVSYTHEGLTVTEPHEVVVVQLHEVEDPILFCDFCGRQGPQWSYLTANVKLRHQLAVHVVDEGEGQYTGRYGRHIRVLSLREAERLGLTGDALNTSTGRWWAACDDCGECLDAGNVDALITRATEQFPAKLRRASKLPEMRGGLRQMYEPVFEGLTVKVPLGSPTV